MCPHQCKAHLNKLTDKILGFDFDESIPLSKEDQKAIDAIKLPKEPS
jgi:hypothetical protein